MVFSNHIETNTQTKIDLIIETVEHISVIQLAEENSDHDNVLFTSRRGDCMHNCYCRAVW